MKLRFKMLALMLATFGTQAAMAQKISVQAITQVAPNLPQYTKVDQPLLRDGMASATQGRVEVTLASWPERNVSGPEVLRLVRSGQVDIAAAPLTTVSGDVPILDGVDLAGMNSDIRQARKVADAMVPVANRELERLGIKLVATYPFSGQMLFCRKPIATLADIKGLKIRTNGPSAADLVKALGVNRFHWRLARCTPHLSAALWIAASQGQGLAMASSGLRCRPTSTPWRCPGPRRAISSTWPGGTNSTRPFVLNSRKPLRPCRKPNGTWAWKPPTMASPATWDARRTASCTP